ncbi:MAG: STAS domain-containing protein [Verrucomicrobiales bacterium]
MNFQETKNGNTLILALEGEADLATAPVFQEKMREKIKENPAALVLDFSGVTFVNTPIWAVVVEYYQHAHKSNTGLAIAGLVDRVEASFNIVRLGEFIPNFPTVGEAVASFEGSDS